MGDYGGFFARQWPRLQQAPLYLPHPNPTFRNPPFDSADFRVLIVRLSPFRDVDRSISHLFLFQEVRRALPDAYVDLAFFPPRHDRERLEQAGVPPLVGIQSFHSAEDFDLLLISNAYTLELVNLPYLLLRSGIPLWAGQRGEEWPILILGGSNGMATQAIVTEDGDSLVDGLFFGEGEGQVGDLARYLRDHAGLEKRDRLARAAAQVEGLWATGSWPQQPIEKAVLDVPGGAHLLVEYPMLDSAEAGTARLQVNFGCPAFCSFCFEGYDRKPYREVPLPAILEVARRLKREQGAERLELYSFNFNTYRDILPLLLELNGLFDRVGFKSQRVDILDATPGLLEAEVTAEKRTFTLGVEGISDRMRAWLHKSLPTDAIVGVLDRLLRQRVREIKLFYILTSHEEEADRAEFRRFVRELKAARRQHSPGTRVIFSFGLLVRMPFTPLRHDRLFLDPAEWRPIVGPTKATCETNGFEFRMAVPWEEYCASQVLAMGGYWLHEPLVELAERGYCYDERLSPGYWEALRAWMVAHGHWGEPFLGEKGPDYPFPFSFVRSNVSPGFLYEQYRQAKAGVDEGYCMGGEAGPGTCLGCGACSTADQRQAITTHRIRQPDDGRYLARLRGVMRGKRRLRPVYAVLRLPPLVAGVSPEWMNSWVMRGLLAARPALAGNLLSARESLFTTGENRQRYPGFCGETVFALRAWDPEALVRALTDAAGGFEPYFVFLSLAEGFEPGRFRRMGLSLTLPAVDFPDAGPRLRDFLRAAYVPCNVRREGAGFRFDLPPKALKKKVLFEGTYEQNGDRFTARLLVGPRFDLGGFLRSFGPPDRHRLAQVVVSGLEW
jgi:radical SAM superfamily enzyme YgiQ (UPF0313 family)